MRKLYYVTIRDDDEDIILKKARNTGFKISGDTISFRGIDFDLEEFIDDISTRRKSFQNYIDTAKEMLEKKEEEDREREIEERKENTNHVVEEAKDYGFTKIDEHTVEYKNGIRFDLFSFANDIITGYKKYQDYINWANKKYAEKEAIQESKNQEIKFDKLIKSMGIQHGMFNNEGDYVIYIDGFEVIAEMKNGNVIFKPSDWYVDKFYSDDINELIEYLKGKEKKKSKEAEEEKKKAQDFWALKGASWLKELKANINYLSGEKLTSGVFVGGYKGKSMSNSAYASESQGSYPLSKWTKERILEEIQDNTDELDELIPTLDKLSLKKLQDICLYEDGWHHTGALYNQTAFYSLESPYTIASRLIERGIIQ